MKQHRQSDEIDKVLDRARETARYCQIDNFTDRAELYLELIEIIEKLQSEN